MWFTFRFSVGARDAADWQPEVVVESRIRPVRGRVSLASVCVLGLLLLNLGADSGSAGNAARGREVLEDRQCMACHSLAKEGLGEATDLGRRSVTSLKSPAGLAALMWNHGPSMWDEMRSRSMEIAPMSKTDADDLFAYFWSLRYFDPRGEAIRGKRVFSEKACDTCHSLTSETAASEGPPVSDWSGLSDPQLWAQQLWNHSSAMEKAMVSRGMDWPEFSEQEMVDLLQYLQNLPPTRDDRRQLEFSSPQAGRAMFQTEACATCHSFNRKPSGQGSLSGSRREFNTITGFTAAMWNHGPRSRGQASEAGIQRESFSADEMGELISYVYFSGGFEEDGDPVKGRRLFFKKGCQSCHGDAVTGEELSIDHGGRFSAARLASAVWSHGPRMLEEMKETGHEWPAFSSKDMADLIAFLNDER
jgi:cytochrome c2